MARTDPSPSASRSPVCPAPAVRAIARLAAAAVVASMMAGGGRVATASPTPELTAMLGRMQQYFDANDFAAILTDPRYASNPTEAVRLSVVSQVLGYGELYMASPSDGLRDRIAARADFLVEHFNAIRSGSAFDGMLALALLRAYEATGDSIYWNRAGTLITMLRGLPPSQTKLNGGLMAAMALVEYAELTGDDAARQQALNIVAGVLPYQNADGSLPHYCTGSTDMHYTAWMGLELILIRQRATSAQLDLILGRVNQFMRGRVSGAGEPDYIDECPPHPECTAYYYSIATGCTQDYDTRGWINELGYTAAVFEHFAEPTFSTVWQFFSGLELGGAASGAFADKWTVFLLPTDPLYVWGSASPSVIRTSVIFWSLAAIAGAPAAGTVPPLAVHSGGARRTPAPAWVAPEPDEVVRARARGYTWSTVDSLLIAGVDPLALEGASRPGSGDRGRLTTSSCPCVPTTGIPEPTQSPSNRAVSLGPTLPNPGHDLVRVRLQLTRPIPVDVAIYDLSGRRLRTLLTGAQPAGERNIEWDRRHDDGRTVRPGLYLLRLESAEGRVVRRIVIR